jgi:hypothetical protein
MVLNCPKLPQEKKEEAATDEPAMVAASVAMDCG